METDATPGSLEPWTGPVESVLPGSDVDLHRELMGAMDAVRDGSIKLTKSGIPPKPLWSAVNDRLQWQDPRSVLYDWDEVDQIRFIYCLAVELRLVQPDEERTLQPGAGADLFFLSTPSRRAAMLARAYIAVRDWDERCDARNTQGHRHNFGQTFRRDFRMDPQEVREALMSALLEAPDSEWVLADALALRLTERQPAILISEDDSVPPSFPGEPEPEIRRLVHYWVFLAARFGWIDLARTPETDAPESGQRVFRLTPWGRSVLSGQIGASDAPERAERDARRPWTVLPTLEVVVYRRQADVGDEYLVRRLADEFAVVDWDEPTATYRLTRTSLANALRQGMDLSLARRLLLERSQAAIPPTMNSLFDDQERTLSTLRFSWGYTAVELQDPDGTLAQGLRARGIEVFDSLALVPFDRWPDYRAVMGAEPTEAFEYPVDPEEPLAHIDGASLVLEWPALPLVARDLLDVLEPAGEPLQSVLDETTLARLSRSGWAPRAVAEAVSGLTAGQVPKRLKSELR
jgi:hypothetical protein